MISEGYLIGFRTYSDSFLEDVLTIQSDDVILVRLYGEDARRLWIEFHETVVKDFSGDLPAYKVDCVYYYKLDIDVPEENEPMELCYACLLYVGNGEPKFNKNRGDVFHIYGDLQHVLNLAKKTLQEASNHIFNLAV